jgi:hypothetical protein
VPKRPVGTVHVASIETGSGLRSSADSKPRFKAASRSLATFSLATAISSVASLPLGW